MNKYYLMIIGIIMIIVGAIIVIAQVVVPLPSSFTINLNPLPPQQSTGQQLFNCPYNQNIQLIDVKVWGQGLGTANSTVTISNGRCQQSLGYVEYSINGLSSSQVVNSLETSINNYIQNEANSNHQPPAQPSPIATGIGG